MHSFIILASIQARLRHRLWQYLLNSGLLIILLAIGEGLLGGVVFKSTLNAAQYGPYWGDLANWTDQCQTFGRLQQFAAWLEVKGGRLFVLRGERQGGLHGPVGG